MRRVEAIMGTMVSLDLRDETVPDGAIDAAVDAAFAWLHDVDRRFSPFKPDSEVARLSRGELSEADASPDLRWVLELCDGVRRTSGGAFDIRRHRRDGGLDPSGLVKGWAVERAADMLDRAGARAYSISAGGDLFCRGQPEAGRPWRVGIQHPLRRDAIARVVAACDLAVATSGAYERGEHVIDPLTGQGPRGLLSMTVVGPSLTLADAYATAAFAMGARGPAWVASLPGYEAFAITADERTVWTPGMERHFAAVAEPITA